MRQYELIYIVHPELDEDALSEVIDRVSSWISDEDGEITNTELWGKRKLAYPIRKQAEGFYVIMQIKMTMTNDSQLERNLRYLEPVMRYSIVSI
ncbi:30S ribosomal protein S6 [Chloroflexota bacterium]